MKVAGRKYEPVTYDGAGHGFMRAGEAPDASPANKAARDRGFTRLVTLIKEMKASPMAAIAPSSPNTIKATATKPAAPILCHDPNMQMPQSTGSM
jgi:carboxymethylenebutenolidase